MDQFPEITATCGSGPVVGSSRKISSGSLTTRWPTAAAGAGRRTACGYRGGEIRPARGLRSIRRTAGSGYRSCRTSAGFAAGDEILQCRGWEHDADFLAKRAPGTSHDTDVPSGRLLNAFQHLDRGGFNPRRWGRAGRSSNRSEWRGQCRSRR